jgi:hypothetical protein
MKSSAHESIPEKLITRGLEREHAACRVFCFHSNRVSREQIGTYDAAFSRDSCAGSL